MSHAQGCRGLGLTRKSLPCPACMAACAVHCCQCGAELRMWHVQGCIMLTRKAMGAQVQDQGSSQITMAGHTRQMTVRNAL